MDINVTSIWEELKRAVEDRLISLDLVLKAFTLMWGVAASIFQIYIALFGIYDPFFVVPIHMMFIGILGFLLFDIKGKQRKRIGRTFIIDLILVAFLLAAIINVLWNGTDFQWKYIWGTATMFDKILGLILIIIVLELTRRCIGWALAIFAAIFVLYDIYGMYFPSVFRHKGFSIFELVEHQYFTTHGLWSVVSVMAMYIMLFIIFGSLIYRSNGGLFIQRFGNWILGSSPGGPAKVSIVTSSMFATISGSSVANVVTTGSFTIPMMKKVGFPPHVAGAIEASASTGGQLMPPIMGAVAFVMADILGIPYFRVCLVALAPSVLYYWSLFIMIDLDARARNIQGLAKGELPSLRDVMELSHLMIPILLLTGALVAGFSAVMAGLVGIFSTLVISSFRKITRMNLKTIIDGLFAASKTAIVASMACAVAGVVVGVVHQSGIGLRISASLLSLTHGYTFIGLILVAIISLILGMGMPTVPAYVITLAIGAGVLTKLGINLIAVHMFILYFAVLSCITPPIMITSYAAASLAEADVWKVGFSAVKLAYIKYIIPFIFVYNPILLIAAVPTKLSEFIWAFLTALVGTFALSAGVINYFFKSTNIIERTLLIFSGLILLAPGRSLDLIGAIIFSFYIMFILYSGRRFKRDNRLS